MKAPKGVVIETRETAAGFRAEVVDGPRFMMFDLSIAIDATRGSAYGQLALTLRRRYPNRTLDFMHVEA